LGEMGDMRIDNLSLGMKHRLAVAEALLGDPSVLVFDEPANGLDPEGIRWIRLLMRRFADEGRTVLMSSHLLSEVEQVADALLVLNDGELLFEGPIELLSETDGGVVTVDAEDRAGLTRALDEAGLDYRVLRSGIAIDGTSTAEIGSLAARAGIALTTLTHRGPTLEDIYLQIIDGTWTAPARTAALDPAPLGAAGAGAAAGAAVAGAAGDGDVAGDGSSDESADSDGGEQPVGVGAVDGDAALAGTDGAGDAVVGDAEPVSDDADDSAVDDAALEHAEDGAEPAIDSSDSDSAETSADEDSLEAETTDAPDAQTEGDTESTGEGTEDTDLAEGDTVDTASAVAGAAAANDAPDAAPAADTANAPTGSQAAADADANADPATDASDDDWGTPATGPITGRIDAPLIASRFDDDEPTEEDYLLAELVAAVDAEEAAAADAPATVLPGLAGLGDVAQGLRSDDEFDENEEIPEGLVSPGVQAAFARAEQLEGDASDIESSVEAAEAQVEEDDWEAQLRAMYDDEPVGGATETTATTGFPTGNFEAPDAGDGD
ncbi:MAG TPA: ABC transporter ATP-binding protein, partial [Microbacterium sp.]|nr:ABC transporter ATP-binding protein [Microbacterium sp.]